MEKTWKSGEPSQEWSTCLPKKQKAVSHFPKYIWVVRQQLKKQNTDGYSQNHVVLVAHSEARMETAELAGHIYFGLALTLLAL